MITRLIFNFVLKAPTRCISIKKKTDLMNIDSSLFLGVDIEWQNVYKY